MSDNKHTGRGFAGKGYYIALILCAAAIGITGYWYYQDQAKPQEVSVQETLPLEVPAGTLDGEDVPVLATQPPATTAPAPAQTTPAPTQKQPLRTASPVAGQSVSGYSMAALSYNQTTRDWRVHNGVDLAAEEGAPVCAAADGEVYTTYEDDALGYTVVIRHPDGYLTCYSSLGEDLPVKAGDVVALGDVIGTAGTSAIVESSLGSHVHFSVTQNDEPMDPMEFLALGQP